MPASPSSSAGTRRSPSQASTIPTAETVKTAGSSGRCTRPTTKSVAVPPRASSRRRASAPAKPPITKKIGITCRIHVSGGYQGAFTVVYSSTGAVPVTVTPTWMPCSTTTARTHSARTRSMAGSRRLPGVPDAAAGSMVARSVPVPESVALAQAGSARSARLARVTVAVAVIAVTPSGRRVAGMLAVVCMGSLLWS